MRKLFCFFLILASSCTLKEQKMDGTGVYFDLTAYFKKEAARLSQSNLSIDKTVTVNGSQEEKKIKIDDWEKEFQSFISADINKASWRGSFKLEQDSISETYFTENEKIPVKKVEIAYRGDQIFSIKIFIINTNYLYVSNDSLSYYPDSLYQIKKTQKIKLLNEKKYSINGAFSKRD